MPDCGTSFFLAFVWWGSCWSWCAWDLPVVGVVNSGGMESEAVMLVISVGGAG